MGAETASAPVCAGPHMFSCAKALLFYSQSSPVFQFFLCALERIAACCCAMQADGRHILYGGLLANCPKLLTRIFKMRQQPGQLAWRSDLALRGFEWKYLKEVFAHTRLQQGLQHGRRVLKPLPGEAQSMCWPRRRVLSCVVSVANPQMHAAPHTGASRLVLSCVHESAFSHWQPRTVPRSAWLLPSWLAEMCLLCCNPPLWWRAQTTGFHTGSGQQMRQERA